MCHGWAAAAGLQLAAASDIVISTQNCKFATPGLMACNFQNEAFKVFHLFLVSY